MKKFIKIFSIFLSISLIVLLSISLLLRDVMDKGNYYQIDKNIKYIFLGHSHPECAYNDSIIENSLNLSSSGESYFYTYLKLKKILSANNHIKTIFIEYTNNVIDKEMNVWTWGDKYINFRLPKYTSSMSWSDYKVLLLNNWRTTIKTEPSVLKLYLDFLLSSSKDVYTKNDWGSYVALQRDCIAKDLARIKTMKDSIKNFKIEESEVNIEYLKKCVEICENNNTKLVLVRSPLHSQYNKNNEEKLQEIYLNNFSKIQWIDLVDQIKNDSLFSDLEHLNYKGSLNYSFYFNELIKGELFNSTLKNDKIEPDLNE